MKLLQVKQLRYMETVISEDYDCEAEIIENNFPYVFLKG